MPRDDQRRNRLVHGLQEEGFDAVLASLPENVLLLSGYFPVVGTSLALATREGEVVLIVPEDERDLANAGGADRVITFRPASLHELTNAVAAVMGPFRRLLHEMHLDQAVIGYESGHASEPSSYAAMHLYGSSLVKLFESQDLRPASLFFSRMKATLTPLELERVRRACRVAEIAFAEGSRHLHGGLSEVEAAAAFRKPLSTAGVGFEGAERADGHVSCMAGPHSGQAFGAYARSRASEIRPRDFVLTHCNSHLDGYWTDITRTYCIGSPDERQGRMYQAVFEAREAALQAIAPGVKASEVDRAARDVIARHGFQEQFKHGTGHGVGFCAIDHDARPRIQPASRDVLESGMVFNIEPGIYFEDFGGLRHCDMVAVTASGAELLTPFQSTLEDLIR